MPRLPSPTVHVLPWLRPIGERLMPGWLAITLEDDTFTWRRLDAAELAHEACHVAQWRRYGLRFIPRYLRASGQAWRRGGHPYRDNTFEIAAREAAARAA
ncbi:MAG: hypothetical protein ACRDGL_02990 [Candidatus Limnocylindrales bacterium]